MKRSKIILIGIAGIFVTGAIVGAFYAPDKGERIRRYVARKGRRFFHSVCDAWEIGKDNFDEIKDRLKDNLQHIDETAGGFVQK